MTEEEVSQLQKIEEIGDKARAFIQSPLGQYLDSLTIEEIEEAKEKLLNLDPYKFTELSKLQSEIAGIQRDATVARYLRGYLAAAIENGNQATHQLSEEI